MKAQEFKNIRQQLGLDRVAFARLIGYTGSDRNDETRIRKYERGGKESQVPLYIARLAWMLLRHHDRTGQLPVFPEWPGYVFKSEPDPQHQKGEEDHGFY